MSAHWRRRRPPDLTLTASGVSDPDGEVVLVEFYRDPNGDDVWDEHDEPLGTTDGAQGWNLTLPTVDWALG